MEPTQKPGKVGWTLFIIFALIIMLIVGLISRMSCDDLEKDIMNAMLSNQTESAGIFKIEKTDDGKNLISLE